MLTCISALTTWYNAREKREVTELVIRAYRVLWIGADVNQQLMEMESGQRGFLLTSDSTFLLPYARAERQLDQDLLQFDSLVSSAEARIILQTRLASLVARKRLVFEESFETLRKKGPAAAAALVASRQGLNLMGDIQQAFSEIEQIERSTLDTRRDRLDAIYQANNIFQFVSFGLIASATLIAWSILRNKEQEIRHLVASLREWNIQLEKRVEERTVEIVTANQKLRELNDEKDRFIGIASHDLKSPLTGIMRLVRLMRLEGVAEAQREYLDLIHQSCVRMEKLIKDILDANQAEQGVRIEKHRISVQELWKLLDDEFGRQAKIKSIDLRFHAVAETDSVYTDGAIAFQIISNLLSNALKFSAVGSAVDVVYQQIGGRACVSVADAGPGISVEELPFLFQRFRKLSARPTEGEHSTGLGLSIAKLLADRLGASIEVESTVGAGSTFRLWFEK